MGPQESWPKDSCTLFLAQFRALVRGQLGKLCRSGVRLTAPPGCAGQDRARAREFCRCSKGSQDGVTPKFWAHSKLFFAVVQLFICGYDTNDNILYRCRAVTLSRVSFPSSPWFCSASWGGGRWGSYPHFTNKEMETQSRWDFSAAQLVGVEAGRWGCHISLLCQVSGSVVFSLSLPLHS